jgi:hypothetical protein
MSLFQKDHPICDEEQWLFELLTSHRSASRLQSDCSGISGAKKLNTCDKTDNQSNWIFKFGICDI